MELFRDSDVWDTFEASVSTEFLFSVLAGSYRLWLEVRTVSCCTNRFALKESPFSGFVDIPYVPGSYQWVQSTTAFAFGADTIAKLRVVFERNRNTVIRRLFLGTGIPSGSLSPCSSVPIRDSTHTKSLTQILH
jgi:hypothetical protein